MLRSYGRFSGSPEDIAGRRLPAPNDALARQPSFKLGLRPEYVQLAAAGDVGAVPAKVVSLQDVGTWWLLTAHIDGAGEAALLRARLEPGQALLQAGDEVWLRIVGPHTCWYVDEELVA